MKSMQTGRPSDNGLKKPRQGKKSRRKGFRFYLGIIVLLGLGVELVLRPLFPDLVKGGSVLNDLVHLALALLGFGLAQ